MHRQPGWFRGLELVFGLIATAFGVLVLIFPGLGVTTLIVVLSVGLLFASFRAISFLGLGPLPASLKVASAIAGVIGIILALLVAVFPGYGAATLIVILSFGLLVYGLSRIFYGYSHRATASWHRGTVVAVGVIDVALSAIVLVLPDLALLTLAVILSAILIVSGLEMVVSGATGVSKYAAAV
jgi:uncharacterized membrane protein HdeD (DUF308 family)